MFTTKRLLKVPEQKKIRIMLRNEVRLFVSKHKMLPPANFETLENSAKALLQQLDLKKEYLDFTIVLFGNEVWRKIVAATPYERRLLLLPQCLRNSNQCKGVFDELGLICSGCQSCQIDNVLEKAEQLGYSTLVAEGTTVAIGLVEEGSVDAVIGVTCMSVLQRSFEAVMHAAVPVLGIPLLYEGCENTTLDYDWLFDEMDNLEENNELQPLSVSLLKNEVTDYFSSPKLQEFFLDQNPTEKLALQTMALGGHRMRPLLSVLAYQSYVGNISKPVKETLAVVIECFHKASLIHDDIQDDEDFRYDKPTLHKTEGIPVAINVGDYLIGKGYKLLSAMPCDATVRAECFGVVAGSHMKLSEGQGADIRLEEHINLMTVDDVLQIFQHKTGEAVKVALLTGAIAGGAPVSEREVLEKFSELFGIAYQIRDDLNEFREENERKHAFDFPFLLALLSKELKEADHTFSKILQSNDLPLLIGQFEKFSIEEKADQYLHQFVDKCSRELNRLKNLKLRLSLYGVMGKVFKW